MPGTFFSNRAQVNFQSARIITKSLKHQLYIEQESTIDSTRINNRLGSL